MDGFTALSVRPDMERTPWDHIDRDSVQDGRLESIGLLRAGTTEGRASVAMLVRLPDGTPVVVQTTWRLLRNAVQALAASEIGREEGP